MKKILVPTDLSTIANLGLKLAVQIAKGTEAVISLVNFTKHPITTSFTAMGDINSKIDEEEMRYTLALLQANKVKLEDLVEQYKGEARIEYSIVDNEFPHDLDEYLIRQEIDLIVMGTSGEENVKEVFTGNHTEQAIRISSCPVISVRDGFSISSFRNIVVAVSVMDDEKIVRALRDLHNVAKIFKATIHLVHVIDPASDQNRDLNEYFSGLATQTVNVPYTINLLEGHDLPETVMKFAREIRAGLVAVIKDSPARGLTIFSNHFSDRMVKEEGRPVLTINPNNPNRKVL